MHVFDNLNNLAINIYFLIKQNSMKLKQFTDSNIAPFIFLRFHLYINL